MLSTLLSLKMRWVGHCRWRPLIRQTKTPMQSQEALLQRILKGNASTLFGKNHGFASIASYDAYKNNVPVNNYEDLRGYIEQQERAKEPALTVQQPIMYAQTSGSSGTPKYIPILQDTVTQYTQSQSIVAYAQHKTIDGVYAGKILAIVSPAVEGHTDAGTPYGSMSGLVYESMPSYLRAQYVVPAEVFALTDYEKKYFLIAAYALAEQNISMIATANPSTLIKIAHLINAKFEELCSCIAEGGEHGPEANPNRVAQLKALMQEKDELHFRDIWPALKAITTWTGGSCSTLIPKLRTQLSETTCIVEMGYLASEFRGSIVLDVTKHEGIPTLHENFFEFVHVSEWGNDNYNTHLLHELRPGEHYYVIVTTQTGLYRYFIDDIIRVEGMYNNTPTIQFVQKGKGITNITGEKLYQSQVMEAVHKAFENNSEKPNFFMMRADEYAQGYTLYVECPPSEECTVEAELMALNIEYRAKRNSGRLQPLQIRYVRPGTHEAYKAHCLSNGQREGQFKLLKLQYSKDCSFPFSEHMVG